jgi:hypothetical protein
VAGELDEALGLEAAQEPAHQPGVEAELVADGGDLAAAAADRVQHPGRAERAPAPAKGGVERPDLGGDGAAEAAETGDGIGGLDS